MVAGTGQGGMQSIIVAGFQTGISLNGSITVPAIVLSDIVTLGNGTAISINNAHVILQSSVMLGASSGTTPANTAISITGANSLVTMIGNSLRLFSNGVLITGGANLRLLSTNFETTTNGIVCSGASNSSVAGCVFVLNNSSSINIAASGAGTDINVVGCKFQCNDATNTPQGTAIQSTTGATILANSSTIENAVVGIQCGTSGDTNTTAIRADSTVIINCTTDVQQVGTAFLEFISGVFDSNKLNIANATNVHFTAFDRTNGDTLAFGSTTDISQNLYEILNGQPALQTLTYQPSYYGSKGTVYQNPNADPTFNATQAASNNANYYVVTGDRTKTAGINLFSDTGSPIGTGNNIRGWEISKLGTSASLAFTYTNNDSSGQALRGANTVMLLDGFNNQVDFPMATNAPFPTNTVAQLVWAGDTNLYRGSAGTLETDGNIIVGGLTPNTALATNGSKQIVSSTTTATELGFLSGTTSNVQTQINGKVNRSGDTMTGNLTLPAGTTSEPSTIFDPEAPPLDFLPMAMLYR